MRMDEGADLGRQGLPVDREVRLGQELARPRPDQVDAQDRAALLRYHLDHAIGLADDHRPAVAREHVLVYFDVPARRPGLGLGQAAPRHLGVGVDDPGHPVVVDGYRALAEDRVDGDDRLGVGDVGESWGADAVAYRVDVLSRGGHGGRVDVDEAAIGNRHAGRLAPDVLGDRPAADGHQDLIDFDLLGALRGLE